ncbi:hypothetical protein PFLUV_G00244330 [Perca fluviatilis]|uniref:Uncharacterized protein n=1 Tax=Perca fluviatilis TaxID=8168 RepID=A0A6A5E146_PERFL|nr:hypothetical protein PFLUV_G00244330 [Perca fluviatilis]
MRRMDDCRTRMTTSPAEERWSPFFQSAKAGVLCDFGTRRAAENGRQPANHLRQTQHHSRPLGHSQRPTCFQATITV